MSGAECALSTPDTVGSDSDRATKNRGTVAGAHGTEYVCYIASMKRT